MIVDKKQYHIQNNYRTNNKTENKSLYWHSWVRITQLPLNNTQNNEKMPSWLDDFMGNKFGVSININNGLTFTFFWLSNSQKEAQIESKAKLRHIKRIFPGLDGITGIASYANEDSNNYANKYTDNNHSNNNKNNNHDNNQHQNNPMEDLYKIKLPNIPYRNKIPIMSTIAEAATNIPKNIRIQINMVFNRQNHYKKAHFNNKAHSRSRNSVDPGVYDEIIGLWTGIPYTTRIFIKAFPVDGNQNEMVEKNDKMDEILHYIKISLINLEGETAEFEKCEKNDFLSIVKIDSGEEMILTKNTADFHFNSSLILPMKRAKILPGENFTPIFGTSAGKDFLTLGSWKKNGVVQNTDVLIKYESTPLNVLIAGNQGVGKTVQLRNIIHQIQKFRSEVGIIVVNTAKRGEEKKYDGFRVVRYTDDDFSLPYISVGSNILKSIKYASVNMVGALGLLEYSEKFFRIPLMDYCNLHSKKPEEFRYPVPENFKKLLKVALEHVKRQYDKKTRERILSVVTQRIDIFRKDSQFLKRINYSPDLPDWFTGWLYRGEKIFLDLIECSDDVKRFLVLALLQLIYTQTENRNEMGKNMLKNVIVFDEAHDIFRKPKDDNSGSDSNEGQKALNNLLEKFFTEFRSRSISTIISDQQPSVLMEAVATQPAIKILFNLRKKCAALYADADNNGFRQFLMEQPHYSAVLLNGNTGERCWMQTNPPILEVK